MSKVTWTFYSPSRFSTCAVLKIPGMGWNATFYFIPGVKKSFEILIVPLRNEYSPMWMILG